MTNSIKRKPQHRSALLTSNHAKKCWSKGQQGPLIAIIKLVVDTNLPSARRHPPLDAAHLGATGADLTAIRADKLTADLLEFVIGKPEV